MGSLPQGLIVLGALVAGAGAGIAWWKDKIPWVVERWLASETVLWAQEASLVAIGLAVVAWLAEKIVQLRRSRANQLVLEFSDSLEAGLDLLRERLILLGQTAPTMNVWLDQLWVGAAALGASDIHVTPQEDGAVVSLRCDGQLHRLQQVEQRRGVTAVNRVKVLAQMRLDVKSEPQDGRVVRGIGALKLDLRASTLPTQWGERLVMRLVAGGGEVVKLETLGIHPPLLAEMRELLARPQGLFLVSGPVGSGKSTTLYAALHAISAQRGKRATLMTLEDPIERRLDFLTQTQVRTGGADFAQLLRSTLRQDPNVLMVGEIRDPETAKVAVQAGLSGHLILTTVHAPDSVGSFARLVELGVDPPSLASATVGAMSQRLLSRLCPGCRHRVDPSPSQVSACAALGVDLSRQHCWRADGCAQCEHRGVSGRIPVVELVTATEALRAAIADGASALELRRRAFPMGSGSLLQQAMLLVDVGEVALDEALREAR